MGGRRCLRGSKYGQTQHGSGGVQGGHRALRRRALPEDRYEEWTEGRRDQLRQLYLALLVKLAGLHAERREYEPAIDVLRRATAEEPTFEEANVELMRLHALSGGPSGPSPNTKDPRRPLQRAWPGARRGNPATARRDSRRKATAYPVRGLLSRGGTPVWASTTCPHREPASWVASRTC